MIVRNKISKPLSSGCWSGTFSLNFGDPSIPASKETTKTSTARVDKTKYFIFDVRAVDCVMYIVIMYCKGVVDLIYVRGILVIGFKHSFLVVYPIIDVK